MSSTLFFWVNAVIAFFIGFLMLVDYRRYKQPQFLSLLLIFGLIAVKSLVLINLPSGWSAGLRYFVFEAVETFYIVALSFYFLKERRLADEGNVKLYWVLEWLQFAVLAVLTAFVVIASLAAGGAEQTTNIPFVEFFKGRLGWLVFAFWKTILLVFAWIAINSVFGYIIQVMHTIHKYKKRLIFLLAIEIFFQFMSGLLNYFDKPVWFMLPVGSLLLLSVFAFGSHTYYVETIQEKVDSLNKEHDMIITLMKEISTIVGMGEFDLDVVIQKIVQDSVRGSGARGGAALLKDPVTNRLIVKYVEGLYPPTKSFKTSGGVTLTESVIVNKFKSEKIAMGEGLLGKVAQDGEAIFIPDAIKDESFTQTVSEHMTVSSFLAVPLKSKEDIFGVLTLVDDVRHFTENDLSLIETLGEQAAITIQQIQMYQQILDKKQAEKEIGVAAEIQSSMIPHTFPETDKFELYGFSIAAKGVGGDYYDYINFGNNKLAMTMFDVSGKGVPASLIMVMIRSILRTIASLNEDTKDVMTRLNNTIAGEIVEDRYATGYYLLFDAEKGIMSYTNAGHGPLVLYRAASDEFEFLDTEGMPIGIMAGVEYGQNYTILEKGDIAILYTDGITECMNLTHEEFGLERFKEVIRKNKRESAREIANRVLEAITVFAGTAPQHDDETLLVLKNK